MGADFGSGDGIGVELGRLLPVPLLGLEVALSAQDEAHDLRLADAQFRGLGQRYLRRPPPAVPQQHVGQVEQADRDRARLAELALDDEVLFEQFPGPGEISVVDLDQGHVVRSHGQFRAVAERSAQVERGLEAASGLGPLTQIALGRSEHGGREGQVVARL